MRKSQVRFWVFEIIYTDGFKEKVITERLDDLAMIIFSTWDEIESITEIKKVKS